MVATGCEIQSSVVLSGPFMRVLCSVCNVKLNAAIFGIMALQWPNQSQVFFALTVGTSLRGYSIIGEVSLSFER